MVACSRPASAGSDDAAASAASRILDQTGSTERRSAGFLTVALSMALSFGPLRARADRNASRGRVYGQTVTEAIRRVHTRPSLALIPLPAGARFQLLDQLLHLAAMVLDVGIEIRTSSHDHA